MRDVPRADPSSLRVIKREGDNFASLQLEASSRVRSGFTFSKVGVGGCDGFTVGGKPENISKYTRGREGRRRLFRQPNGSRVV